MTMVALLVFTGTSFEGNAQQQLEVSCAWPAARLESNFTTRHRLHQCAGQSKFNWPDSHSQNSPVFRNGMCGTQGKSVLLCSNCSTVINLSCKHPSKMATYHRVADCLAREYWTLKTALSQVIMNETCLVGYANRIPYYTSLQLMSELPAYYPKEYRENIDSRCISFHCPSSDVVSVTKGTVQRGVDEVLLSIKSRKLFGEPCGGGILIVNRTGTRSWEQHNFSRLLESFAVLATKFNTTIEVHNSDDGINTTITKFQRASVVVAFHGAALANMFFAPKHASVFEISTYRDLSSPLPWRNVVTGFRKRIRPDLNIHIFGLSLMNVSVRAREISESGKLLDAEILNSQNIQFSLADIQNLTKMISLELTRKCPVVSSAPSIVPIQNYAEVPS